MVKISAIEIALCVYLQLTLFTSAMNVCTAGYRNGVTLSTSSVFRTQIQQTLASCQKSCIATASCEAFTYNLRDLWCFYGGPGSAFEYTSNMDYVTNPIQWKPAENEGLIRPCTHGICQKGSECIVMKNGSAVCIETECLSVTNSTDQSLDPVRTIGHSATLFCNNGFIISGNPHRTCTGNGQWTGGTCTECESLTHYTTYDAARQHCLAQGKRLLQYEHIPPTSHDVTQISGRCKTCPGDLVADLHKRYLNSDCTTGYKDRAQCTCHLTTAAPDMKIKIMSESFDLENIHDVLYIYDGEDVTYPLFGQFTDRDIFTLVTKGTEAFMVLKTDYSRVHSGFNLSYLMVSPDVASDLPTTMFPQVVPRFLWLEGYLDAVNRMFQLENGIYHSVSELYILADRHSRLCYDPVSDQLGAFGGNDYCSTYCETP